MLNKLVSLAALAAVAVPSAVAHRPWPGELAVVSAGRFVLFDRDGSTHVVPGPSVDEPAWSPDGEWVAYLRASQVPGLEYPSSALWVARADGTNARQLSPDGASVDEFYWVPREHGELLAFSAAYTSPYSSKLFLAVPGSRELRTFATYSDLIGFSVAPSGAALAVSYRQGAAPAPGKAPTWRGLLQVVPISGSRGRTVYTLPEGGYVTVAAGWWPDGKGLLFWYDPAGSASIAADGLALDSLDLATGKVRALATTLTYRNWVAWSPGGHSVAVVAGGNRVVWDSGKHLVLCSMPVARCNAVALSSADLMALTPTWTSSGSLVYDVAPATASPSAGTPPGLTTVGSAPWSQANVAAWYGDMRLYVASPSGHDGHPLAGADAGAHDPVAITSGLLFVRGTDLEYLPTGGATAVPVVGGLASPDSLANNYYGYIAWYQDFAWHD